MIENSAEGVAKMSEKENKFIMQMTTSCGG